MRIALVAAVARNGVIGAGGGIPWRISDDLRWFKKVTMGKPVVMGRKTFESIGAALPGRENIVITRAADWRAANTVTAPTVAEALKAGAAAASRMDADEICVIGGGEIYALTIHLAHRIYLTEVDVEISGDTFFPAVDLSRWRKAREGGCAKSGRNQYSCEFFILDRVEAED